MSFSIRSRHLSLPALALGFAFACSSTPQDGPDGGGGGSTASGGAATGGSSEDPGATGGSPIGGAGAPSGGDSNGGGELPRGDGFHRMEKLDRGLVAVVVDGGVYVGFRMHGYEYDPENPGRVAYAVYRDGAHVTTLESSTNYLDADGSADSRYTVRLVLDGVERDESEEVTPWTQEYLRIPIEPPGANYQANDGSAGDVDGDGQYELFLKWEPNNAKDNSQSGHTDDVYIDALKLDGTRLWRINLGRNIRAGAHYTQFIVYDFDGDGKAELAMKTAPGTRDGTGAFLSKGPAATANHDADYRNDGGYILTGPEYLTVFSGETGEELATTTFEVGRENVSGWGNDEGYGNRVDRFLATAAHLDDTGLGSIVMARGYYGRSTLTAWNFRDGELTQLWKFDSNQTPTDASGNRFTGQGAHSLSVANVDDDPQQEIIYGAMTIDHDGKGLCSTNYGHGDALHVTDLIPSRPGIEAFMPHENTASPDWTLWDPGTCEIIHKSPNDGTDTGRGVAADIDPDNPGAEMWASGGVPFLSATTAQTLGSKPSQINFVIWWDGDESRELEDGTTITKYGGGSLLTCGQCASNNGTKSTPTLSADLFGDWREEIVWRESNNAALRVYTTTHLTQRRIYTLMHDPQYRAAISWQNVAYNQPPHPSFHIGAGMADPPAPDIHVR